MVILDLTWIVFDGLDCGNVNQADGWFTFLIVDKSLVVYRRCAKNEESILV